MEAMLDRMPASVGCVTLFAGAVLTVAPGPAGRILGLEGQDATLRAIGIADLALVPGLLGGRPRWPWMLARAGLNLAQGAALLRVAPEASSPQLIRGTAAALAALTPVDAGTALALRAGRGSRP